MYARCVMRKNKMVTVGELKKAIKKADKIYAYVQLSEDNGFNLKISKRQALSMFDGWCDNEKTVAVIGNKTIWI